MAFAKTASAKIVKHSLEPDEWTSIRGGSLDRKTKIATDVISKYNPSKYLLSHCTIIASVDVDETGPINEQGWYYHATPETEQYVNSNCFVAGTQITLADGTLKSIETVEIGDTVLTHLGRPRSVLKTYKREIDETIFELRYQDCNHPTLVTNEHPLYTYRNRRGMYIPIKELDIQDYVVSPFITDIKLIELSKDLAYLIGLYATCGSYENDCIKLHLSEEYQVEDVQDFLKHFLKVSSTTNNLTVIISDQTLISTIRSWVKGDTSDTMCFVGDLLYAPKDILYEILLGWIDNLNETCGNIYSRSLANQIHMMLWKLGIFTHNTYSHMKNSGERWHISFHNGLTINENKLLWNHYLRPITSLKEILFKGSVYNLEVEEDNSYVADGIAVHNCDSWERQLLLQTYKTFIGAENYCFAPDMEVLMSDGTYKPIKDIVIGDSVISHTGRSRKVVHKFERPYTDTMREIYIDKNKDPIVITPNHKCRVLNVKVPDSKQRLNSKTSNHQRYINDQISHYLETGETYLGNALSSLKKVIESLRESPDQTSQEIADTVGTTLSPVNAFLREYPEIFISRALKSDEKLHLKGKYRRSKVWNVKEDAVLPQFDIEISEDWIPAGDLEPGMYMIGPDLETHDQEIVGIDAAVLLGYYLSEGCQLHKTDDKGVIFTFGPHEGYLVEDTCKRIKKVFHIEPFVEKRVSTLAVHCNDKEISRWFRHFGSHLSHLKKMPEEVFTWSREELLHILVGWLTGDGDFHTGSSRLRGTTVSKDLAYQMMRIADLCKIKSCVVFNPKELNMSVSTVQYKLKDGTVKNQNIKNRNHIWTLHISPGSVNEIAIRSLRWKDELYNPTRKRDDLTWWGKNRIHKIRKISDKNDICDKVYNIEVEEDHTYIVAGMSSKNCEHVQIPELSKGKIIDAVARDLGDTVYIDILVATDRKHKDLIADIESGKISTLSMGCFIPGTQITMGDSTKKNIEDIRPDDTVITHEGHIKRVDNLQIRIGKFQVQRVWIEGYENPIISTDNHPYFVVGGTYEGEILLQDTHKVRADRLQSGDVLYDLIDGEEVYHTVSKVEPSYYEGPVYNLEVEDDHSYIADGVAVHNCTVQYTVCSRCGKVAKDDTEMCDHIKYAKGNHFFDKKGKRRRIFEFCGHNSDPESVEFIEASWVANPAFKGAVMRNILTADDVTEEQIKQAYAIDKTIDVDAMRKAASYKKYSEGFDFDTYGDEDTDTGDSTDDTDKKPDAQEDDISQLTQEMKEIVRNRVRKELRDELQDIDQKYDTGVEDTNENLVRSSYGFQSFWSRYAHYDRNLVYRLYEGLITVKTAGWKSLAHKGYTGREILALSRFIDAHHDKDILDKRAYNAISIVGGTKSYNTPQEYLNAVGKILEMKQMTTKMARHLIYKGILYNYGV